MKPICRVLLLLSLLAVVSAGGAPLHAAASENLPPLDYVLKELEKRYTGSQFSADFLQESTIKTMEITDFAAGRLYVRYPGMMRWEYEKPERQVIITDGKKLWIYRPQDNLVMVGNAPVFFRDGKGASFLSDISLVRKKFKITLAQAEGEYRPASLSTEGFIHASTAEQVADLLHRREQHGVEHGDRVLALHRLVHQRLDPGRLPVQDLVVDLLLHGERGLLRLLLLHPRVGGAALEVRDVLRERLRIAVEDQVLGETAVLLADLARASRVLEIPGPDLYYAALFAGRDFRHHSAKSAMYVDLRSNYIG